MKKTVLAAAAVCSTVGGAAHAQSSVTLYGIVDQGINYNSNMTGKRSYALQSGVLQGNRRGLRGAFRALAARRYFEKAIAR
ncbi:hypothetical protein GCM10011400_10740 [Paraburkholderia caffeinilytica]|uniref:Porin domain-containing protein n=1 Tax=Paraburkholderia caffeinilytica TaxID=1761016 RepID=A0ABQ1LMZ3_9BURK|nr:hypothetical protein GCM10011400_10740 [Paraburkholderia caffeinilytica]CAB3807850.1 hypothetical protein LMG28690_06909 [Paraburkholderia caffeinilytica]